MFFIYTPQNPSPVDYDEEEAYLDYKRREYVKRLQAQQQRVQFERELQLEKQRHQAALAEIARKETLRRQHAAQLQAQTRARAEAANRFAQTQSQQHQHPHYYPQGQQYNQQSSRPTPQDILARRLARQREEEGRSRDFHKHILSQIFGVPEEEFDDEEEEEEEEPTEWTTNQPTLNQLAEELSKRHAAHQTPTTPDAATAAKDTTASTTQGAAASPTIAEPVVNDAPEENSMDDTAEEQEQEPHWSLAPQRDRSLADIAAINRAFNVLKNTFVFPSGPLERLPDSQGPRLAFNSTNATIHAYEHALTDLLSKLDGVESYGFKGIREARKQMVVKIEKELEDLEQRVAARLAEPNVAGATPVSIYIPIEVSEPAADVEMKEKEVPVTSEATKDVITADTLPSEPLEAMTIPTPGVHSAEPVTTPVDPLPSAPVESMTIPTPVLQEDSTVTPASAGPDAMDVSTDHTIDAAKPVANPTVEAPKLDGVDILAPSTTPALPVALPETASDEELEVEDAVHIVANDYESEAPRNHKQDHKSDVGDFEML